MKLLVIEDSDADAALIEEYVADSPYPVEVVRLRRLDEAMEQLDAIGADVIACDLGLPDSQGIETALTIVSVASCPVVVMTGADEDGLGVEALSWGAQDFLSKDELAPRTLFRALHHAVQRHELQEEVRSSEARLRELVERNVDGMAVITEDGRVAFSNPAARRFLGKAANAGELFTLPLPEAREALVVESGESARPPLELRANAANWNGAPARVVSLRDVSDRLETERLRDENAELERLATVDPLTNCLNRRGLEEKLATEIASARRRRHPVSVLLLDCDDFKAVNEEHGHVMGDAVLREIARRGADVLRAADELARIGGDEFLALLPGTSIEGAARAGERIRMSIADTPILNEPRVQMTVSVTAADLDGSVGSLAEILTLTREGLSRSKGAGKNRVTLVGSDRASTLDGELAQLREIIAGERAPAVLMQPIVGLVDGSIARHELSVDHADGSGMIEILFAAARRHDLATAVDFACLDACIAGLGKSDLAGEVAVNLLPTTVLEVPVQRLMERLEPLGSRLCIELSQRTVVPDPVALEARVRELKAAGVRIALDEIRTHAPGLDALVALAPEVVKFDIDTLKAARADPREADLVRRICTLARAAGCDIVVEGLRSNACRTFARELGATHGQGPLFAAPSILPPSLFPPPPA